MPVRFGPAGIGPVKDIEKTLAYYNSIGIKAAEIPFTYGVYIKNREDAEKVKKASERFGISLSIHAPYWVNLNSAEKIKVKQTKERILKCCEVGTWLGATNVVFHPGFYGKMGVEETYDNIKKEVLEMQGEIKKKKYSVILAPETTGKVNVFGGVDEIHRLVEETGCGFCIDFAHLLARYKDYKFKEIFEKFKKYKKFHIHFSGIEYGDKGEKFHKMTPREELRKLISHLPKDKEITIINESPSPVEDSILGNELHRSN